MDLKGLWALLYAAYQSWKADKASTLAAALAFYAALSLAPLLVMVVAVAGLVYSTAEAQSELLALIDDVIGSSGVEVARSILEGAAEPGTGGWATALSLLLLLLSASGLFAQLQAALTIVWKIPPEQLTGLGRMLLSRLLSMAMVLGLGILLLLSLLLSVVVSAVSQLALDLSPALVNWLPSLDLVISFLIFTLLFGAVFKILPRVTVAWRLIWPAAALTSGLFIAGKFLLSIYLSRGAVGSAYGVAGSLLALLVWVYYSAQIMLYGAEFAYVYSRPPAPTPSPVTPATGVSIIAPPGPASPPATPSPTSPTPAPVWQWLLALGIFVVGVIVGARDTRRS